MSTNLVMMAGLKYTVFSVKTGGGHSAEKPQWRVCGSAWVTEDGGINIYLDMLPMDGTLHIREKAP